MGRRHTWCRRGVAADGASSVGTQLTVGNQDVLDPLHTVYAPSVSLGSQTVVGDVDANTLTNSGGFLGTLAPYPSSVMPLMQIGPAADAGNPEDGCTGSASARQTTPP